MGYINPWVYSWVVPHPQLTNVFWGWNHQPPWKMYGTYTRLMVEKQNMFPIRTARSWGFGGTQQWFGFLWDSFGGLQSCLLLILLYVLCWYYLVSEMAFNMSNPRFGQSEDAQETSMVSNKNVVLAMSTAARPRQWSIRGFALQSLLQASHAYQWSTAIRWIPRSSFLVASHHPSWVAEGNLNPQKWF